VVPDPIPAQCGCYHEAVPPQEDIFGDVKRVLDEHSDSVLVVSDLCAQLDQWARLGWVLPLLARLLDAARQSLLVLLCKHLRAHIVVDILHARDQSVLACGDLPLVAQLEGPPDRGRVGKSPRVVVDQAGVELFGVEMPYERVGLERQASPELLVDVQDAELELRIEEVASGEVERAVASQLTQRERAGLLDPVVHILE
jgi:hypothetical protein